MKFYHWLGESAPTSVEDGIAADLTMRLDTAKDVPLPPLRTEPPWECDDLDWVLQRIPTSRRNWCAEVLAEAIRPGVPQEVVS